MDSQGESVTGKEYRFKMAKNSYSLSNVFLKLNQLLWKKSFLQRFRSVFYYVDAVLLLGTKAHRGKKYAKISRDGKKEVLIVYNMALGDGVMFMGVAEHFRDIYPAEKYRLTIACQSAFKDLYIESGIFDEVIPFDFAGSVVNLKKRRALFKKLRQKTYDIVIDPIGCERCTTNIFVTRAAIGKEKIGVLDMCLPSKQCPKHIRNSIYDKVIEIDRGKLHLIEFYAAFLNELGVKDCVAHPAELKHAELDFSLPEKFFIVFPAASMAVKRWPYKAFGELATRIYDKTGMKLVVCGTKHDEPSVMEFLAYAKEVPVINVIGQTSIMQFMEVIGRASLIITNDTSAYHIGVAKQVDTVMICGGYTYDRYAHYQYERLGYKDPVLVNEFMDCYNCDNNCIYNNKDVFPCIKNIKVEKAWNVVEKVIDDMNVQTGGK